ncbi:hypothetical protein PG991_000751 [Apiospora marii]|uniref:YEATS domain-containing protein n=1 Tax=Apiospora marii TaxID=335849 RepID=A0ABR1SSV1_9PEZI
MVLLDVDVDPSGRDPVPDIQARCPMCRTFTTAFPNRRRRDELRARYPQIYTDREAEAAAADADEENVEEIMLYIGNRHQDVAPAPDEPEGNTHDWTLFVRTNRPRIIEEVHFFLPPMIKDNHIVRTRAPYQILRRGKSTYWIAVAVVLRPNYTWVSEEALDSPDGAARGTMVLEWMLDFEGFGGRGSMGRYKLKFRDDRNGDPQQRAQREYRRVMWQYRQEGQLPTW